MSDRVDQSAPQIHFPPDYADCIAHVADNWASLEYKINTAIWELADVRPSLGACMTSQIISLHGRISALLALMKLRQVKGELITKVNKFAERVREPQELRNRIIHDQWVNNPHNPDSMGRIEIVAPKKLSMEIKPVNIEELRRDLETISHFRLEFESIRRQIRDELPTLPQMSQAELYPVTETPRPR